MTIKVGDKIPEATLKVMTEDGIKNVSTSDLFAGKKVAFFGVPGAYTPTCSAKHVPGFLNHAADFKAKGVDSIVCLAVNDPFVMGAWAKDQGTGDTIVMAADGNAELTDKMGVGFDASGAGLGHRNRRFSMIVENSVVKTLNLEEGGAYEVSSPEQLLEQL